MIERMRLTVLLPTEVLLQAEVSKIVAEAQNGAFGLLPRHIDFVTALAPGIFSYFDGQGEHLLAMDEGILVKRGAEVSVSTYNAISGIDLATLKDTVEQRFRALDEHERLVRTALARLEAGTLRRFLNSEPRRRG